MKLSLAVCKPLVIKLVPTTIFAGRCIFRPYSPYRVVSVGHGRGRRYTLLGATIPEAHSTPCLGRDLDYGILDEKLCHNSPAIQVRIEFSPIFIDSVVYNLHLRISFLYLLNIENKKIFIIIKKKVNKKKKINNSIKCVFGAYDNIIIVLVTA